MTGNVEDFVDYPLMVRSNTETLAKVQQLELGKVYAGDPAATAFMTEEEFNRKWNINQPKIEPSDTDEDMEC